MPAAYDSKSAVSGRDVAGTVDGVAGPLSLTQGACLGRSCEKLTDAAIAAVAKGCPNLTSLDVG